MASRFSSHIKGNAIAYVALFIALGGTSYAAIKLPANSVGNRQLKANAVTTGKVKNGTLRRSDFKAGQLSGTLGPRGVAGPTGPAGPVGSLGGNLPSGVTLRGRFEAGDGGPGGNASGDIVSESISFGARLATAPTRTIIPAPATSGNAQCPGTVTDPEAAPGQLCIYVGETVNLGGIETILEGGRTGSASRQGVGLFVVAAAAGTFGARGSWAVTAP